MRTIAIAAAFACALAGGATAETALLVIGNEDYDRVADVRRADEVGRLKRYVRRGRAGDLVLTDAESDEINAALASYGDWVRDADAQLVVLAGRFVHSPTETYYLPSDSRVEPLAGLTRSALPLSTVLAYLSATPGASVLALATDGTTGTYGWHLEYGIGDLDLPQGVTLLRGEPRAMSRALSTLIDRPGSRIAEVASQNNISASGYLRADLVLREAAAAEQPAEEPQAQNDNRLADLLAWRQADRANTAEAYEGYIDSHPTGQFVRMAENRLKSLTDTPEARAERDEQRLDLNRDQRREVQRNLSLLEYNTRGIDGIFGRGTRTAIATWQGDNGFAKTSYLTAAQIERLNAQAERRSAQLEAEAEARREAQMARDRAYWEETGAQGDEDGYRIYLERYPDGEFSELARTRLKEIERRKRGRANALDRQLWDEALSDDTVGAYRDYLDISPDGAFRQEATDRITELQRTSAASDEIARAQREERALNLSASTRRLVEARLNGLGLKPGEVDGEFDDNTRRAIRRYQQARDLPETGYMSEAVVVRLLADTVRSLFR